MIPEVGSVWIRRGANAPFIIAIINDIPGGEFEILKRMSVNSDGSFLTTNRVIHSRNLSMYEFIAREFMDSDYVKWATQERGGLFMVKKVDPPPKKHTKQIDAVKAVFYRQNRYLNPRINYQEVERLWNESYFPLYTQVLFELDTALQSTGTHPPLNYEPPTNPTPAPDEYKKLVVQARPFEETSESIVDALIYGKPLDPEPDVELIDKLLAKEQTKIKFDDNEREKIRRGFTAFTQDITEENGNLLTGGDLKYVLGTRSSESFILAVKVKGDLIVTVLDDFYLYTTSVGNLTKTNVVPNLTQVSIIDSGKGLALGEYEVTWKDLITSSSYDPEPLSDYP